MLRIALASALSLGLLIPAAALAQQGQQQTGDQAEFQHGVKAHPQTMKRRNIVRSEYSNNSTNRTHRHLNSAGPTTGSGY
jgi:hypothetical protein